MSVIRQAIAVVFFFAAMLAVRAILGPAMLGAAMFGVVVALVTLGLGTGYWVGKDGRLDRMVIELARRFNSEAKFAGSDQREQP